MHNSDLIKQNLDFFSELTQRTLSDFHVTNTSESLTNEIDEVKRFLTKAKFKKLWKVEESKENIDNIILFFKDGTQYEIDADDSLIKEYDKNDEYKLIDECLSKKRNPITNLRFTNKIENVDFKDIETPGEKIFFM